MGSRALGAATAAVVCTGLSGVAARAASAPPGCTVSGGSVTCTFTSGHHPFVVPDGVRSLRVVAVGGRGGNAEEQAFSAGGHGDVVSAEIAVTPGRTLYAVVGGNGQGFSINGTGGSGPGANGGGAGGNCAGGGGGASDLRTVDGLPSSRLLVAAGGGGAGCFATLGAAGFIPGGPGGNATQRGTGSGGGGGEAGAASHGGGGGAGGSGVGYPDDMSGSPGAHGQLALGGDGGPGAGGGGGGGGGGLYGGGGGGGGGASPGEGMFMAGGGGGGGSDLVPSGGTASTDTSGRPRITISYRAPRTG